jgi:hypothetical protein
MVSLLTKSLHGFRLKPTNFEKGYQRNDGHFGSPLPDRLFHGHDAQHGDVLSRLGSGGHSGEGSWVSLAIPVTIGLSAPGQPFCLDEIMLREVLND